MQQFKFYILDTENFEEIKNKLNELKNADVLYYTRSAHINQIKKIVQEKNIAFLTNNETYAYKFDVDGLILPFQKKIKNIKQKLKDKALGILCQNRDEAMHAGEDGADFIIFYGDKVQELIPWWTELFTLPCLSLDHTNNLADFFVYKV
ncbi:MAG: thiamine phosphate synthase [Alphaproteobacteria bacterium]|nr:thiamine phosphate synthase [Alphaproteobacteria bacterium]